MSGYLTSLGLRSWGAFWDLIKIMVPVMILVKIAQDFGVIEFVSPALEPVMQLMGLPAEAGVVWLTGLLVGIYAAIAAFPLLAGLDMTVAQMSTLGAVLLIAHALPVEQAIIRKAGGSFLWTSTLRVGSAIVYGIIISQICRLTGFLSEQADMAAFKHLVRKSESWPEWLLSSTISLALVFVIIIGLLLLLDVMEKTGITRRLMKLLSPLLRFSGLNEQTTPVTTVGILLGLSYGGALIIQKVKEEKLDSTALSLSLCWLCLSHALIEDTAVIMAIGGDLWIILFGRILFTLLVIKLIATIMRPPVRGGTLASGEAGVK